MTSCSVGNATLELIQGDITHQKVDAIVNAANAHLAGGGGVDGAIHRAAGPSVMDELNQRYPDGCPTGSAVITSAGKLKARYIIHAVGPRYSGGERDPQLLASAYQSSLKLCEAHKCASVAFPSIATGIYRYPLKDAARIALESVQRFLASARHLTCARFVLFDTDTLAVYERVLGDLNG